MKVISEPAAALDTDSVGPEKLLMADEDTVDLQILFQTQESRQ